MLFSMAEESDRLRDADTRRQHKKQQKVPSASADAFPASSASVYTSSAIPICMPEDAKPLKVSRTSIFQRVQTDRRRIQRRDEQSTTSVDSCNALQN